MTEDDPNRTIKTLVLVIVVVFLAFWAGYHFVHIRLWLNSLFG